MMGLLTIVFLAALVGILKPYLGALTRKHFAGIAGAAFVGLMILAPKTNTAETSTTQTAATTPAEVPDAKPSASAETVPVPEAPASKWSYSESEDEMRGTKSRFASITSENEVDLDFPYGEQRGKLTLRKNPSSGLNIMFAVDEGQILCNSFTNTKISVKFDGGPVRSMSCTGTDDGSSHVAFFTNEGPVLAGLKKAKRTIIEADFYQKGSQQFVFETAGLNWK